MMPLVKWTGTKRHVAKEIVSHFPREIETYYEPFIGSASLLPVIINSDIKIARIVCSDINKDLINIYNLVKSELKKIISSYFSQWSIINSLNPELRKDYYNSIREQYNLSGGADLFLFLTRVCYNGLIRYNKKGKFNSPYHFNRPGINAAKFEKLVWDWHTLLKNVVFMVGDYKEVKPKMSDFIFLDPPYFNVTTNVYFGQINFGQFIDYLRDLKCKFALTLDGKNLVDDRTCHLPDNLNLKHSYLKMGKSSLRRLKGKSNTVEESLYKSYE